MGCHKKMCVARTFSQNFHFGNRCKIRFVDTGPDIELVPLTDDRERNWLPVIIAAVAVVLVSVVVVFALQHRPRPTPVTPVSAAPDPYAVNLPISGVVMSESSNLAGSKVTYVDGHVNNTGNRTVTAITVQVLFRDFAKEVTQNETQPLRFIRMRDPYVDVEPVSAAPLQPGQGMDFRLIFDAVSPDWDGAYPEIRVVGVDFK